MPTETTPTISRRRFLGSFCAGVSTLLAGCGPRLGAFQAKATTSPPIKNCFDTLGHQPGYKPFVLVEPGRNNPSLYAVNGRPVYVHLNGLAIVRLK